MRWSHHPLFLLALVACDGAKDDATTSADDAPVETDDDTDADTPPDSDAPPCFTLADGSCVEETFANPPVLAPDEDGVFRLTLAPTEVTLAGQRHCVRAYNGSYVAPTIDTPARQGDAQRVVRVDLVNALSGHDWRSLDGAVCTCTDALGAACTPGGHGGCAGGHDHGHDDCTCVDEDGEVCEHLFDFNVTNLHAHGSHVRPDWARGGDACTPEVIDGITVACRDCDADTCDGASDDACFHGDDVLSTIGQRSGARFRWDIDEDGTHHEGMQWYHPHIHGTTAIQVASGAAGAWLVRGPVDALPGVAEARERILIFSTPPLAGSGGFQPLASGEACTEETLTFDDFPSLSRVDVKQLNLVNGERTPRMITPPGQLERWRILHAGFLDEVFLGLFRGADHDCTDFSTAEEDTLQLTQIGRDGLLLPEPFEYGHLFMSPGYRIEGLIDGARLQHGDTWCLVAARFLQEHQPDGGPGGFFEQTAFTLEPITVEDIMTRFDDDGDVVAILNVTDDAGPPTTTTAPDVDAIAALAPSLDVGGRPIEEQCAEAAAITSPEDIDQAAVLQVGFTTADDPDPCECKNYNVNCNNFEATDRSLYPVDRDLPLDTVEHWRVAASVDGHPFHIHINPYVVCPNDNVFDPIPFPHWRDTYLVNLDRQIDLITENKSYTGPFVFHCHKLTHEDHGMMEVIRVCDPATDATCGDYGWRECAAGDLDCAQALAATDCAITADDRAELVACVTALGAPLGVCGPNACATDEDCEGDLACIDHVCVDTCVVDEDCPVTDRCDLDRCVPAPPCLPPCGPGETCAHGTCE